MKTKKLISMMAFFSVFSAMAEAYYVKPDGDDSKDGKSWENAFATPNKGFAEVNNNRTGTSLIIRKGEYALTRAIGCNGGGKEAERAFVTSETGNPDDVVIYSDGTFECLRLGGYIQVSGITFSNGVNSAGCVAGGVRFAGAKPSNAGEHPGIVSNCIVTCCRNVLGSGTNGAAVVMYYNDLLVDSVIRNNTATKWYGGGVLMVDYDNENRVAGGPLMQGCRVEDNSAVNGAGVYVAHYSGSSPVGTFNSTDVKIVDCEIVGNRAENGAGLLCMSKMTIDMVGCVVSNNVATSNSGGIRLDGGCNVSMRDSLVFENRAVKAAGFDVLGRNASLITTLYCSNTVVRGNVGTASGGGVRVYGSGNVFFDDCLVEGNRYPLTGGGVDVAPEETSLVPVLSCKNTVFRGNEAENAGGAVGIQKQGRAFFDGCRFDCNRSVTASDNEEHGGGGIFLYEQKYDVRGYCSLSNCVFAGNSSNTRSGGMGGTWNRCYFGGAIVNCIFTNNISRLQGGGLTIRDNSSSNLNPDPPIIRNCLFAFNATTNQLSGVDSNGGGVLFVTYSDITLENCTIVSNNICNAGSSFNSGGIHHRYTGGKLKNCIVAFNTARGEPESTSGSAPWTAGNDSLYSNCCGYPAVPSFTSANGCVAGDPKFTDPAHGDFTLLASSPCRNAGANAGWMTGATDLFGKNRICQGTVDIGCYEYRPIPGMSLFVR